MCYLIIIHTPPTLLVCLKCNLLSLLSRGKGIKFCGNIMPIISRYLQVTLITLYFIVYTQPLFSIFKLLSLNKCTF